MAVIKVTLGGVGVKYTDVHGHARYVLKTREDAPFECDDKLAESYVRQGVAEYVVKPQIEDAQQDDATSGVPSGDSGKMTGHLDPEELESMTVENLKKLAADMDLDVSACKKKADYVNAIAAVEVEIEEAAVLDDDDELPDLSAADPE